MSEAYIVDAVRTAGGRRGGSLAGWHPVDLAAQILDALVQRNRIDPAALDDVILGCVSQAGEQASNVARNAVLASCLPESVPGTTIDRQCGSSQQALHFAAQAVISGTMDVVIAGGVESMSRVPLGLPNRIDGEGPADTCVSPAMRRRYPGVAFNQFTSAEMIASKYRLEREQLDAFSLGSHQRACEATRQGWFQDEIVRVEQRRVGVDGASQSNGSPHEVDDGIRFDANLAGIAAVKSIVPNGRISAASASQICDGASGVLVVNERGLARLSVAPLARICHMSVIGHDPVIMLEAPIPATVAALRRAGLHLADIDLFEVNEAFASVPLAWLLATGADPRRLNVHGGAIALGHPLGASGTRLITTLVHALRQRCLRFGLSTMCEGGGMANVTIIERLASEPA